MLERLQGAKLGLGDFIANAWVLFSQNFTSLLVVSLITSIPITFVVNLHPSGWLLLFAILLSLLSYMAVIFILDSGIREEKTDASMIITKCFSRLPAFIWTAFLGAVFSLLGIILFILPGIYLGICYSFSPYAVLLREKSGREALNYSSDIVKPQFLTVFGYFIVLGIAGAIVSGIIQFTFGILGDSLLINILLDISDGIVTIFFETVLFVWFLNSEHIHMQKKQSDLSELPL